MSEEMAGAAPAAATPAQSPPVAARAPRSSLAVLAMVLFLLSESHVLLYDFVGIRALMQVGMGIVMLALLGTPVLRQIYRGQFSLFVPLCFLYVVVDVIWRHDAKNIAGYLVATFLTLAVSSFSVFRLRYFASVLLTVLTAFAIAGFVQIVLVLSDPSLSYLILKGHDAAYYGRFHIQSPVEWLGAGDSVMRFLGRPWPRFVSYFEQASTLPAFLLLPCALILISGVRYRKLAFIPIVFAPFSLGGSVAFCLITSLLVFFIGRRLPRRVLTALPFVILPVFAAVIFAMFRSLDYKELPQVFEISQALDAVPEAQAQAQVYGVARANSGFLRALLLMSAVKSVAASPIVGMRTKTDEIFASLILTSGMRAGVVGLVVAVLAFWSLFSRIGVALYMPGLDRVTIFGLCLLYAAAAQSAVYNDYGFSKFWGLTMLALAGILLERLPPFAAAQSAEPVALPSGAQSQFA